MSGRSLGRKSLPVIMAEQLEKDISKGLWVDTLAGYRALASHYEVSDRTTKLAIQLLVKRGIIAPPQQGKKCKILKNKSTEIGQKNLLIITDSSADLDRSDEKLLNDISAYWLQRKHKLGVVHHVTGDYVRYTNPGKLLAQWIHQYTTSHILFYEPPAPWIKAVIKLGIPCYYLGGEIKKSGYQTNLFPGSSHSIRETLSDLFQRLKALGHIDLLIPFEHGRQGLQKYVQNTLYEAYNGKLNHNICELSVPVFSDFSAESWLKNWEKQFVWRKPTCVIVSSVFALQSLYVFCSRHQLRIGKDLSVICMSKDSLLDWYSPRPTYLEFPYSKALQDFKSWVRNDFPLREHAYLKMIWNEGETVNAI